MEVQKCVICEADFRKSVMVDGKCPLCLKEHPDAKNKQEVLSKIKTPNKMEPDLNEAAVRNIVGEMLDERFAPLMEKIDALGKEPAKRGPGRPRKEDK